MTNKNYYLSSNYVSSNIPTREEFHRFASNELSLGDFCTNYSSGYQVNRVFKAIKWTYENNRGRKKKI